MGEGEGEVDVSEQIENEDQMLGSHKGDKEETTEEDTRDKGHEDKSKGIEMQEEFEGDLHDLSVRVFENDLCKIFVAPTLTMSFASSITSIFLYRTMKAAMKAITTLKMSKNNWIMK